MSRFTRDSSFAALPCFMSLQLTSSSSRYRKNLFSHFPLFLSYFNADYESSIKSKGKNGEEDYQRFFTCISISPIPYHLSEDVDESSESGEKECFVYLRKIIYVYFSSDGLTEEIDNIERKESARKSGRENVKSLRFLLANIFYLQSAHSSSSPLGFVWCAVLCAFYIRSEKSER